MLLEWNQVTDETDLKPTPRALRGHLWAKTKGVNKTLVCPFGSYAMADRDNGDIALYNFESELTQLATSGSCDD